MKYPTLELLRDAGLLLFVFANWIMTSLIADAATSDVVARRVCSVYIAFVACGVNSYNIVRSWRFLGASTAPSESVVGIFLEICNLTQAWGSLFAAARYFSLSDDDPFFTHSLIRVQAESIFEMSLVQSGTGWAATAPTTAAERIVAWMAAYVGGVLCTNMFLLSVVLSRRAFWQGDNSNDESVYRRPALAMPLLPRGTVA